MQAGARLTDAIRHLEAAFLIGVEGTTEIWLVRHGDCYEGMEEGPDPALSPKGLDQAKRLAARVKAWQPAAVHCSPARRAVQTARELTEDAHIDERLREMTFMLAGGGEIVFTEKPEQVVERMGKAIDEIAAAHAGQRVVVVGHAGAILNYLCDVMRLEPGRLRLLPYYTSVSLLRVLGDRKMVGSLADIAHLE